MNPSLSAIAEQEGDASRFMPPVPVAHHDHRHGRVEEVPLVSKDFLMRCGVEALYIVLSEIDAPERFDAETKEQLADLIIAKTQGQQPAKAQQAPPLVPPSRMTAREKRFDRSVRRQVKDAMRTHGSN